MQQHLSHPLHPQDVHLQETGSEAEDPGVTADTLVLDTDTDTPNAGLTTTCLSLTLVSMYVP